MCCLTLALETSADYSVLMTYVQQKGENICSMLPAFYCLTGCVTTNAFVRRGKILPLKLVEKNADYISALAKLGEEHVCSSELLTEMEKLVYGKTIVRRYQQIKI